MKSKTAGSPDKAFHRLCQDIMQGRHAEGGWLPTERELAESLGFSRPTIRLAVQQLASMNLVELKPHHRVRVRPARFWFFDALPAFILAGSPGEATTMPRLLQDTLRLRRELVICFLRMCDGHVPASGLDLVRQAVLDAWKAKDDPVEFLEQDLHAVRLLLESCGVLPALWLLNNLDAAFVSLGHLLHALPRIKIMPDYLTVYMSILQSMEQGRTEEACRIAHDYLERLDVGILGEPGPQSPAPK